LAKRCYLERAVFDYGRLEITRKWGKMNELEMNPSEELDQLR
jgi:hypothetical protein